MIKLNLKLKVGLILLLVVILLVLYWCRNLMKKSNIEPFSSGFDNLVPSNLNTQEKLSDIIIEFKYLSTPLCSITTQFLHGCCLDIENKDLSGDSITGKNILTKNATYKDPRTLKEYQLNKKPSGFTSLVTGFTEENKRTYKDTSYQDGNTCKPVSYFRDTDGKETCIMGKESTLYHLMDVLKHFNTQLDSDFGKGRKIKGNAFFKSAYSEKKEIGAITEDDLPYGMKKKSNLDNIYTLKFNLDLVEDSDNYAESSYPLLRLKIPEKMKNKKVVYHVIDYNQNINNLDQIVEFIYKNVVIRTTPKEAKLFTTYYEPDKNPIDLTKSLTLHEANKIKLYHNERIFTLPSDPSVSSVSFSVFDNLLKKTYIGYSEVKPTPPFNLLEQIYPINPNKVFQKEELDLHQDKEDDSYLLVRPTMSWQNIKTLKNSQDITHVMLVVRDKTQQEDYGNGRKNIFYWVAWNISTSLFSLYSKDLESLPNPELFQQINHYQIHHPKKPQFITNPKGEFKNGKFRMKVGTEWMAIGITEEENKNLNKIYNHFKFQDYLKTHYFYQKMYQEIEKLIDQAKENTTSETKELVIPYAIERPEIQKQMINYLDYENTQYQDKTTTLYNYGDLVINLEADKQTFIKLPYMAYYEITVISNETPLPPTYSVFKGLLDEYPNPSPSSDPSPIQKYLGPGENFEYDDISEIKLSVDAMKDIFTVIDGCYTYRVPYKCNSLNLKANIDIQVIIRPGKYMTFPLIWSNLFDRNKSSKDKIEKVKKNSVILKNPPIKEKIEFRDRCKVLVYFKINTGGKSLNPKGFEYSKIGDDEYYITKFYPEYSQEFEIEFYFNKNDEIFNGGITVLPQDFNYQEFKVKEMLKQYYYGKKRISNSIIDHRLFCELLGGDESERNSTHQILPTIYVESEITSDKNACKKKPTNGLKLPDSDILTRISTDSSTSLPTLSPAPDPAPSPPPTAPSPAPDPAPSPAPDPAPSPAPDPSPSPAPEPDPSRPVDPDISLDLYYALEVFYEDLEGNKNPLYLEWDIPADRIYNYYSLFKTREDCQEPDLQLEDIKYNSGDIEIERAKFENFNNDQINLIQNISLANSGVNSIRKLHDRYCAYVYQDNDIENLKSTITNDNIPRVKEPREIEKSVLRDLERIKTLDFTKEEDKLEYTANLPESNEIIMRWNSALNLWQLWEKDTSTQIMTWLANQKYTNQNLLHGNQEWFFSPRFNPNLIGGFDFFEYPNQYNSTVEITGVLLNTLQTIEISFTATPKIDPSKTELDCDFLKKDIQLPTSPDKLKNIGKELDKDGMDLTYFTSTLYNIPNISESQNSRLKKIPIQNLSFEENGDTYYDLPVRVKIHYYQKDNKKFKEKPLGISGVVLGEDTRDLELDRILSLMVKVNYINPQIIDYVRYQVDGMVEKIINDPNLNEPFRDTVKTARLKYYLYDTILSEILIERGDLDRIPFSNILQEKLGRDINFDLFSNLNQLSMVFREQKIIQETQEIPPDFYDIFQRYVNMKPLEDGGDFFKITPKDYTSYGLYNLYQTETVINYKIKIDLKCYEREIIEERVEPINMKKILFLMLKQRFIQGTQHIASHYQHIIGTYIDYFNNIDGIDGVGKLDIKLNKCAELDSNLVNKIIHRTQELKTINFEILAGDLESSGGTLAPGASDNIKDKFVEFINTLRSQVLFPFSTDEASYSGPICSPSPAEKLSPGPSTDEDKCGINKFLEIHYEVVGIVYVYLKIKDFFDEMEGKKLDAYLEYVEDKFGEDPDKFINRELETIVDIIISYDVNVLETTKLFCPELEKLSAESETEVETEEEFKPKPLGIMAQYKKMLREIIYPGST